jgi:hypothetical protein
VGIGVVAKKPDLRRVEAVVEEFHMTPEQDFGFRDYLHECKESGDKGTANDKGDYTIEELREKAREYLGE